MIFAITIPAGKLAARKKTTISYGSIKVQYRGIANIVGTVYLSVQTVSK